MYHCAKFQSIWSIFNLDQICQGKQFLGALSQKHSKKAYKTAGIRWFQFFYVFFRWFQLVSGCCQMDTCHPLL